MSKNLIHHMQAMLDDIREQGLYKQERPLESPQGAQVHAQCWDEDLINLCANNYLGLANHPDMVAAAHEGLDSHGFGMASVRFICGTQDIHKQLERKVADFLRMDDAILFSSCFDANGGIFEVLLGDTDAVISDSLNHASIIDGIRLSKAERYRYANNDMADLEAKLIEAQAQRFRLVVTDGVFSMDGTYADLPKICELAEKYDALVMVDDSHAIGFVGERGAGTPEFHGVEGGVHLTSGTFGKALGGASGGYITGPQAVIDMLRQRARPYLFSNSLAPPIVNATLAAIDLLEQSAALRQQLAENTAYFRRRIEQAGFDVIPGSHPIVPIMTGDALKAQQLAAELMQHGVYVTAFSFPVVPKGQARVRTQMSAAHSREQLDRAIDAFIEVGKQLQLIS
ncbi:MAG: glycine C-acetyltransferase [Gammaproteobacteria bacterium]|nr:MAG: glycine C-acetyltransferase [Gammaproteobacteria bacterium]UCH39615.1 MAG: glycine C-acetyltransferase [Gammaproteobacteria bacterium]